MPAVLSICSYQGLHLKLQVFHTYELALKASQTLGIQRQRTLIPEATSENVGQGAQFQSLSMPLALLTCVELLSA